VKQQSKEVWFVGCEAVAKEIILGGTKKTS